MSSTRRSSIPNIEEWLDLYKDEEPDSMIYDDDYPNEMAQLGIKSMTNKLRPAYKEITNLCTNFGFSPDATNTQFREFERYLEESSHIFVQDLQNAYNMVCEYKQELLNKVQKMTSDLYLPPYMPEGNITLLQHCKRLKTKFKELNTVREERMIRERQLQARQVEMCQVLGKLTEPIKKQTDIPTEEELNKFATAIKDLEREVEHRKNKFKILKDMINKCADLLEISCPADFSRPDYSESNLLAMTELHSKLEGQYAKNQQKFERLTEKLVSLYDRLDITGPERDLFLQSHSSCKPGLMAEMEVKIDEYEELKKQNIGKFIEKIKQELAIVYDRCCVKPEELEGFLSLSSEASEELLKLYEAELERLKRYYDENRDILEKFEKWRLMFNKLIELKTKANDPNRFNNRGGQLLAEERERKKLQRDMPKIEKELREMNDKYAERNGGAKFKVLGDNLNDLIDGAWDELNHVEEEEKRARQRAKMTPSKKNQTTTNKVAVIRATPIKRAVAGGSRLLGALSLSEQEFQEMAVARPTSAKRLASRIPHK